MDENRRSAEEPLIGDAAVGNVEDIVAKNNQNTLLLNRIFEGKVQEQNQGQVQNYIHKMIAFQGESRTYFFDGGRDGEMSDEEQKRKIDQCQDLLLKLYVAPIIRLIKVGNTFFGLLDNASYACIILLLVGSSILSPTEKSTIGTLFDGHYATNVAIVVTMGSDLLHNIMHYSTRLWNLSRIDIHLVMLLYAVYVLILALNHQLNHESGDCDWVYWYVLAFRFGCFYLATCCEYWLEIMVLQLIRQLKTGEDFTLPLSTCKRLSLGSIVQRLGYPYSRLSQNDREMLETFKGSFCCWNWKESSMNFLRKYHAPDRFQRNTPKWSHLVFIPGGIIAFLLSMVLLLLLGCLASIPLLVSTGFVYLFQCCCQCCNWGIHEEIWLW